MGNLSGMQFSVCVASIAFVTERHFGSVFNELLFLTCLSVWVNRQNSRYRRKKRLCRGVSRIQEDSRKSNIAPQKFDFLLKMAGKDQNEGHAHDAVVTGF